MIHFSNSLVIHAKVEHVFEYLKLPENFSKWNYAVKSISKVTSTEKATQSLYHLHREVGLQVFEEIILTDNIPNRKLSFEATGKLFSYKASYEIAPILRGTSLTNTMELASSANHLMVNLFKRKIKKEVNQNLLVLKKILEEDERD
ncbi:SRPBCC family protein [Oceanobacillus saliphilus]|uniref:SRPBCC family protein n=1 Tax=Oceanobacillus saliphilus TaxID=2925834 RepID=UPI00201DD063